MWCERVRELSLLNKGEVGSGVTSEPSVPPRVLYSEALRNYITVLVPETFNPTRVKTRGKSEPFDSEWSEWVLVCGETEIKRCDRVVFNLHGGRNVGVVETSQVTMIRLTPPVHSILYYPFLYIFRLLLFPKNQIILT